MWSKAFENREATPISRAFFFRRCRIVTLVAQIVKCKIYFVCYSSVAHDELNAIYRKRYASPKILIFAPQIIGSGNVILRPWQSSDSKLQYDTGGRRKSPWDGRLLPCSQRLSTTWLDHAVLVIPDHIFRSATFGLTTPCFVLLLFLLAAATAVLMLWPIFWWPHFRFRGTSFDHILDHSAVWTTWRQ